MWGRFDVMAHLGYPERYIWGKYRIPVSFAPYEDVIQSTLKLLVETGRDKDSCPTSGKQILMMPRDKRTGDFAVNQISFSITG